MRHNIWTQLKVVTALLPDLMEALVENNSQVVPPIWPLASWFFPTVLQSVVAFDRGHAEQSEFSTNRHQNIGS
jgi:hypothetical protein